MRFVHFTAPDGDTVAINPDQVEEVKDNEGAYDARAHAVIILTAGFHAVRESKAEVEQKLEGA